MVLRPAAERVTVRIGFLGTGLIAGFHAAGLARVRDAAITSVYDTDPARAAAYAAAHGGEVAASPDEVIDRCDAVYVTTWTAAHPELVAAVADAGKAVFCEKPLATDLAGARAMTDTVERAGVVNQVGLVLRYSPAFRWLHHEATAGDHGPVMSIVFRDDQYIPIQGMYGSDWRGDVVRAGAGTLLEHSIHDLDLIEWLLGRVVSVSCRTANHHRIDGIEDQASVVLESDRGGHAVLSSTWHDVLARPSLRSVEVFCRRASLGLGGDWFGPVSRQLPHGEPEELRDGDLAAAARERDGCRHNPDAAFVAAVRDGTSAFPGFATARRAHELVDACYRSAAAGGAPVAV